LDREKKIVYAAAFFFFALAFFLLLSLGFKAVMPALHTSAYRT
jgi:arginine exporter protein ArgO